MSQDKKLEPKKKAEESVEVDEKLVETKKSKSDFKVQAVSKRGEKTEIERGGHGEEDSTASRLLRSNKYMKVFMYCLWVVVAFYGVQLLISLLIYILPYFSLQPMISVELEAFLMSSLIFGSTVAVALVVPALVLKRPIKGRIRKMLGLEQALPRWRDIGLAVGAYITCFAAAIGFALAVQILFPSFDMDQAQSLPFDQTQFYAGLSLVWIYLTLGVAAPVGEELIFRGYLFGRIRRFLPASLTIVITAIVFSMLHVIGFSDDGSFRAQWNVVVAILPLAIGLGILREYTGSVWASIILHSIQNTVSFVLLFIVLPTQGLF